MAAILFFKILSKFVQTVHTNFHAKSGLCSSRNERVMLNFVNWRPFCFWRPFYFSKFCQNLFRLSIRTSMQNLESVAQKMSELWHLVRKRTNIYLSSIFKWLYSPNFISPILEEKTKINEFSHQLWVLRTCFYVIHIIEPRPLYIFKIESFIISLISFNKWLKVSPFLQLFTT